MDSMLRSSSPTEPTRRSIVTTAALVRAAELSGICPLARVREISRPAVLKLLDVGVQGLIVPNVKTLEQVQELVNNAK